MPNYRYVARGSILRSEGYWPDLGGGTPPPPSTRIMLLGASRNNPALTVNQRKYAVHRTYDTGNVPVSYAASAANGDFAAGMSSLWSAHPDPVAFASGAQDAAFNAFLATVPSGTLPNGRPYLFYCNLLHEADVKVNAKKYTPAQAKAAMAHEADLIAASGRTNIISCVNTTMQPFYTNQGYTMTDFWTAGKGQVYLLDAYNRWGYTVAATTSNHYNGLPWSEMAVRFEQAITWLTANNVRWGIAETNATEDLNTLASQPGGLHDKSQWLINGLKYCYDRGCEVFTYWDNSFNGDFDLTLRQLNSSAGFQSTWESQLALYGSS